MYKIIKAKTANVDAIVLLNKQFHLDIPNFKWVTKRWINLQVKKRKYYILVDKNSILGAMHIEKNEKEYHITTIAIKREMQGKELGEKMIDFAKEISIKNRIHLLTVGSFVDYKLDKFYTKCGFTKKDKLGTYKGHSYFKFFMKL